MAGSTLELFIDDTGNKEYPPDRRYKLRDGGITPYFVFGGLLVKPAEAGFITRSVRDLKMRTFGDDDGEIKAPRQHLPAHGRAGRRGRAQDRRPGRTVEGRLPVRRGRHTYAHPPAASPCAAPC